MGLLFKLVRENDIVIYESQRARENTEANYIIVICDEYRGRKTAQTMAYGQQYAIASFTNITRWATERISSAVNVLVLHLAANCGFYFAIFIFKYNIIKHRLPLYLKLVSV